MIIPASSALATNGSISGRASGRDDGQGVNGTVILFDYATGNPITQTSTDNGGDYTIGNVTPGDYKVCFFADQPSNYVNVCYLNSTTSTEDFSAAGKVTVPDGGAVTQINGLLPDGGKVSGYITNAQTNAPVQYALAVAYDSTGTQVSGAEADASGHYTLTSLATGDYTICFGSPPGQLPGHGVYHAQCYNGKPYSTTGGDKVHATEGPGQEVTGINAALVPHYVVALSRTGPGSVTSSPAGIACGGVCSHDFDGGTLVKLTPHPATGYRFAGWTGGCTGTGACQFTLTGPTTVGAKFVKKPVPAGKPTITDSSFNAKKHKAKFNFTGTGASKGFQCALIKPAKKGKPPPKPKFSACKSPKTYKKLKPGGYTFEVRGVSASLGPGPAAKIGFSI